jgi:type I restriction enzyme S subunit
VRVAGGLLPNWLVYQPHLDASSGRLAKQFTGTTIGHLPREAIVEYELRLAPLPEQHRIVEAIESYFTRLDDAVATLERVQRNLKRYRASVLKAAVEGRLVPTEAELARAEGRDYEPASVLLERILAERRRRGRRPVAGASTRNP